MTGRRGSRSNRLGPLLTTLTGGNDYARLRIGIGNEFHSGQQVSYVLGEWSSEERDKLPEIIQYAADTVKSFGAVGLQHTMNQFNKK